MIFVIFLQKRGVYLYSMKRKCCSVKCSGCDNITHKIALLANLDEESLTKLNDNKKVVFVKKNKALFTEGSRALGLYCIHKGKIKIHKMGNSGREQIVRFAKSGDIVGYRAFIDGDRYYATATAMEDSEVCFFPYQQTLDLVKNEPGFLLGLLKHISEDLKTAEDKITHLTQNYVNQRVAESLLWLKDTFGYKEDGETIDADLSRSELAGIAGTTPETTIRVLSEFQKKGLIKLQSKSIHILKEAELKSLSELPY